MFSNFKLLAITFYIKSKEIMMVPICMDPKWFRNNKSNENCKSDVKS